MASREEDCRASADCIDRGRCALDHQERRCVGPDDDDSNWLTAGIVLSSIGPGLVVLGVVPTVIGFRDNIDAAAGAGVGCLFTGSTLLLLGLVSFGVASTGEPKRDESEASHTATARASTARESVSLQLTPTGASLSLSFF